MRRLLTCALSLSLIFLFGEEANAAKPLSASLRSVAKTMSTTVNQDPNVPLPESIKPSDRIPLQTVALNSASSTRLLEDLNIPSVPASLEPPSSMSDLLMWGTTPQIERRAPTRYESPHTRHPRQMRHGLSGLTAGIVDRTRMLVSRITASAMHFIGTPYSFGGTTAAGFDCSGYVQQVFLTIGVRLPRTADQQFLVGQHVNTVNAERGDLVFFQTYAAGASHVGIYLGNNEFIHSSSSRGVTVSNLREAYWAARFLGVERVLNTSSVTRIVAKS